MPKSIQEKSFHLLVIQNALDSLRYMPEYERGQHLLEHRLLHFLFLPKDIAKGRAVSLHNQM